MARLASILLVVTALAQNGYAETWVTINNKTLRISGFTNCQSLGASDRQAVCDCCLIKNTIVSYRSAQHAVSRCAKSHRCQFEAAASLTSSSAMSELLRAKKNLKSMTIVDLKKLTKPPQLPKNGVLTKETIMAILRSLTADERLALPSAFFDADDDDSGLKIKELGNGTKGLFTGQLFSIRYDAFYVDETVEQPGQVYKPLYILKETKKGLGEIDHLYRVSSSSMGQEKVSTHDKIFGSVEAKSMTMANIAFDDIHFKLKTGSRVRYFSLLQTAPGQSLHHHLSAFGKIASKADRRGDKFQDALVKMKHIFFRIGFAMSELHQKYAQGNKKEPSGMAQTYTHGDLHSENVFYDEDTDQVTLIDNETIALSLDRPSSGVNDLVDLYMLHTIRTIAHRFTKQLTTNVEFGIDDTLWHDLWQELFGGYLSAYGSLDKEELLRVYNGLRTEFFNGFSHWRIFKSVSNFKDQRKLKRFGPSMRRRHIQRDVLEESFDRLHETWLRKYQATDN